jgi:aspartate dehydrogenase
MTNAPEQRVAIAGLGAIGQVLARALDGGIPGARLTAVALRNPAKAAAFCATLSGAVRVVALDGLADHADIVIECAPSDLLAQIAEPALKAGKRLIVLSVGGLLVNPHLEQIAARHGGQILVPTGALIGLDAVTAAAEGTIHSVRMITRKPPRGLLGAPYLVENNIDVSDVKVPLRVFSGSAREAAKGFPANLNVAVGSQGVIEWRFEIFQIGARFSKSFCDCRKQLVQAAKTNISVAIMSEENNHPRERSAATNAVGIRVV